MKSTTTVVEVDLAKRVCQWHGVERETGDIKGLKRSRATCLDLVAPRPPCGVAREACGGAPHGGVRVESGASRLTDFRPRR